MNNQLKYFLGFITAIPLIPFMYFQGKKVKASVPVLPEAINPEGVDGNSKNQINLLAIGESTIAGVGVEQHKNGLTGAVSKFIAENFDTQVNWKVVAKSGYTAQQVAKNLIPKIGDFKPDIILIGLGANDAFQFNSPNTWRKSMNTILTRLNNTFTNSKIVCINMPPIKEFPAFTPLLKGTIGNLIELFRDELMEEVKHHANTYFIDKKLTFNEWITNHFDHPIAKQAFFSDGIHPSMLTYQTWGKEVAKYILEKELIRK